MKFVKYNINQNVKVKLTKTGKKILWEHFKTMNDEIIKNNGTPFNTPFFVCDNEGYYTTQMWELIQDFEGHIGVGLELPYELDILIEVDEES